VDEGRGAMRVIFIGGPASGTIMELPDDVSVWKCSVLPRLDMVALKELTNRNIETLTVTVHEYRKTERMIGENVIFECVTNEK
jgi:hypothetical protein